MQNDRRKRMAKARNAWKWVVVACCAVLVSACGTAQMTANTAGVTGTAMYRERMALPEGAVFEASLIDVSRADGAADVVGEARFAAPTGLPIRFNIPYDPGRIDAAHRYGVRARILHQEKLLFTT